MNVSACAQRRQLAVVNTSGGIARSRVLQMCSTMYPALTPPSPLSLSRSLSRPVSHLVASSGAKIYVFLASLPVR